VPPRAPKPRKPMKMSNIVERGPSQSSRFSGTMVSSSRSDGEAHPEPPVLDLNRMMTGAAQAHNAQLLGPHVWQVGIFKLIVHGGAMRYRDGNPQSQSMTNPSFRSKSSSVQRPLSAHVRRGGLSPMIVSVRSLTLGPVRAPFTPIRMSILRCQLCSRGSQKLSY
jgi:hypothetical protein